MDYMVISVNTCYNKTIAGGSWCPVLYWYVAFCGLLFALALRHAH